jgi:uncharacterized membrane protein
MIDEEVKIIAIGIIGLLATVTVFPLLAKNRIVEPFSELGILGPNGKIGDYPHEVEIGQNFKLYIYIGNYEGRCQYYRVLVKLGDQNSNISDTKPLDSLVIANRDYLLPNESNITSPITLSIQRAGLNQRLVFELYRYDTVTNSFLYHERWAQIWMNVTIHPN